MEFDNTFEVPLPPAEAWPVLMDIRRIAPCMPGAQLTEVVDKTTYKGNIAVRLGPVALTFAGTVKFEEIDDANRTARVKAQGTDAKGRGGANAAASFRLEPAGTGSKVLVHTDLALSGSVASTRSALRLFAIASARSIDSGNSGFGSFVTLGNCPFGSICSSTGRTRKPCCTSTSMVVMPPTPCRGVKTT